MVIPFPASSGSKVCTLKRLFFWTFAVFSSSSRRTRNRVPAGTAAAGWAGAGGCSCAKALCTEVPSNIAVKGTIHGAKRREIFILVLLKTICRGLVVSRDCHFVAFDDSRLSLRTSL